MKRETEVKIAIDDAERAAAHLVAAGARPLRPREWEDNLILDRDGGALAREGTLLRVRRTGGRGLLTVKGPDPGAAPSAYKVRREAEAEIPDPAALVRALQLAGFRPAWRYQKWRRTFALDGAEVTIEELPFGSYLEIEGEPAAIESAARRLGYGSDRYETASYRELHERRCLARGEPAGDLVFAGAGEPFA